ncbi:hypothetical protein [Sinorhizobium meliloti]|uniref:hypothetical protein n=1 Tax=Rhizobium meliloti TaxID=382 RepID=UPI00299E130A|nr:hypothetical protein [Sinorhizobium meliloti]MDW9991069.1 hypothetical protein [Sinorhizobium meliloti]MDX0245469.1 hypothetical protein [Sinorhizobium meliloti]MDX0401527.1 hypothetical protein [Sinorhizobium meliloti]
MVKITPSQIAPWDGAKPCLLDMYKKFDEQIKAGGPNKVTVEDLIGEAPANGHIAKWESETVTETPAKPATVTEAELFNEALSSLRAMVSGEVRSDPVRLEAIRYQLENADYLSEEAKRVE